MFFFQIRGKVSQESKVLDSKHFALSTNCMQLFSNSMLTALRGLERYVIFVLIRFHLKWCYRSVKEEDATCQSLVWQTRNSNWDKKEDAKRNERPMVVEPIKSSMFRPLSHIMHYRLLHVSVFIV